MDLKKIKKKVNEKGKRAFAIDQKRFYRIRFNKLSKAIEKVFLNFKLHYSKLTYK